MTADSKKMRPTKLQQGWQLHSSDFEHWT